MTERRVQRGTVVPSVCAAGGRHFFLMLVIFTVSFLLPAFAGAVTADDVEIRGLTSIGREEFLGILGIRKGSPVTEDIVRSGIKRAFRKGIFEDICVTVPPGEKPVVGVTVRERDFIRGIRLSGHYDLSKKTILQSFPLKEGQLMRHDRIEAAEKELKEKLADHGFPGATVTVKTKETTRPHRIDLDLTIDTGVPLVIKSIRFNVVPPYPPLQAPDTKSLAGVMKLASGDVYDKTKVDKGLDRLKEYFKRKGYFKAVAGPYSYRDGELEVSFNPGKRLEVKMEGNSAISTRKLLKEVPFFEIGEFNDETVDEAVARVIALYHKEGYPFAQVAPIIHGGEENIDATFFIYEGPRIKVSLVRFAGNSLPEDSLRGVMSLRKGAPYNPDLIDPNKNSLKEFYGALGFLEATVKGIDVTIDREKKTASLLVDVEEGKKTTISSVEITGVPPDLREKLMKVAGIKEGDPYNEVDISNARFRVLEYCGGLGYPDVDVTVDRSAQDYKAAIAFKVTEGAKKFFGKTIVSGNAKTQYRVISRELNYREGEPYNFRTVAELRQKLYRLGIFSDVEIDAIDGSDEEKDIVIKVAEGNPGAFEFGIGYGEWEKIRGFAQLSYANLFGMNRQGMVRTELSTLERRIILQYIEPWFLGRPLPFRTFFLYEHKRELNLDNGDILYKLNRYTVSAGVEKKLSPTVKAQMFYEFSLVNTFDVLPDVVLTREDTGTLAISALRPAVVYDTRDNPFDPKKGFLAGISLKAATFLLFSQTNFVKVELYANKYQKLSDRLTLAVSARGGVAYGYKGTDELPIVERFFLGGGTTVRGYEQDTLGPKGADGNPTGGNAYLMGNIELRTDIGKGIGIVPFVDMGNVWIEPNSISPGQLKYTTGLGLRYNTPVGPLRVDYGFKLNKEPGESIGALHFSIGQAF